MPQMPCFGRGCPGPGAYSQVEPYNALKLPKDFNQARETAVFAQPTEKSAACKLLGEKPPMPGPGQYDQDKFAAEKAVRSCKGSFDSKTKRDGGIIDQQVPGPGEYMTPDGSRNAPPGSPRLIGVTHGGKSNFQEPCRRRIVPIHPDLPTSDAGGRDCWELLPTRWGACAEGDKVRSRRLQSQGQAPTTRTETRCGKAPSSALTGPALFNPGRKEPIGRRRASGRCLAQASTIPRSCHRL